MTIRIGDLEFRSALGATEYQAQALVARAEHRRQVKAAQARLAEQGRLYHGTIPDCVALLEPLGFAPTGEAPQIETPTTEHQRAHTRLIWAKTFTAEGTLRVAVFEHYLHVSTYRMPSGRYEVTAYVTP